LALAADRVLARKGVILNPHYKSMGNLYGSEYWTYLLPRRVGWQKAIEITQRRLPLSTDAAAREGLIDACLANNPQQFIAEVAEEARRCARHREKKFPLPTPSEKPLAAYRYDELEQMKRNFYGFDPSYHVARYNFVHKVRHSRTPFYLAQHRSNAANSLTNKFFTPGSSGDIQIQRARDARNNREFEGHNRAPLANNKNAGCQK
jgi:putative two-component system hydrogenase maturation factor HypX/HoxX